MTILRRPPSGPPIDLASGDEDAGLQTAWAIDAVNGNDGNLGTPSAPLRTMREFNARYRGVFVTVPATLSLLSDVIDTALMPQGTAFGFGASLTVSGTRTVVASGITVTGVAQLGNGGAGQPFELTTTGIDWTTQAIGSQIRITSSATTNATNALAFLVKLADQNNVSDPNKVVVGQFLSTAGANITPVVGDVLSLNTLSKALPPNCNVSALSAGTTASYAIIFKDLQFQSAFSHAYAGCAIYNLFGCEIVCGTSQALQGLCNTIWQGCRFTLTAGLRMFAPGQLQLLGCVFGCPNATQTNLLTFSGGNYVILRNTHDNVPLRANGKANVNNGLIVFRNTKQPIGIDEGALFYSTAVISGATGNSDSGSRIDRGGGWVWFGAGAKPTVTGGTPGTDDMRIGGTSLSYASVGTGYYALFNNANPNSVLNLVGPGGGAWAAQG